MNVLLLATFILGGFDFGGRIAGVYPVGGLSRFHSSSALVGACVGYSTGRVRFELGYGYSNLPGTQATAYRLGLHGLSAGASYDFVRQGEWGIEASAGLLHVLAQRTLGQGHESGQASAGELGLGFVQYSGKSRLAVGLAHTLLFENGSPGLAVNQLFAIRATVAYAP